MPELGDHKAVAVDPANPAVTGAGVSSSLIEVRQASGDGRLVRLEDSLSDLLVVGQAEQHRHALGRREGDVERCDWLGDGAVSAGLGDHLEGEVILSADTAATVASELGNSSAEEQLLYVIHGVLHLVGYDDQSDSDAEEMRTAQARFLQQFGVEMLRKLACRFDAGASGSAEVGRAEDAFHGQHEQVSEAGIITAIAIWKRDCREDVLCL